MSLFDLCQIESFQSGLLRVSKLILLEASIWIETELLNESVIGKQTSDDSLYFYCHRALENQPLMGAYRHFKTSHPLRVITVVNSILLYGVRDVLPTLLCLAELVFDFLRRLVAGGTELAP